MSLLTLSTPNGPIRTKGRTDGMEMQNLYKGLCRPVWTAHKASTSSRTYKYTKMQLTAVVVALVSFTSAVMAQNLTGLPPCAVSTKSPLCSFTPLSLPLYPILTSINQSFLLISSLVHHIKEGLGKQTLTYDICRLAASSATSAIPNVI
jgi:hypothetical protein